MSSTTEMPAHHKPNVPAAVKAAAEAAQRAFDRAREDAQKAGEGAAPPSSAEPPAPPPGGNSSEPAAPTQTQFAAPVNSPAPAADTVDWKHRYDSLYGKHTAEMSRMQSQIEGLQTVLASIQAAKPAAPAHDQGAYTPSRQDQFDLSSLRPLSEEERADYSDDFISVTERIAAQRFAPIIQGLQDKISQLESGMGQVRTSVQVTAQERVFMALDAQLPDWQAQNTDPAFNGWLAQPDIFSGLTRKQMLDNAMKEANADRVIAFFKAYRNEAAARVAPSPQPSPQPAAPQAPARTSLETLAAPGRGRPGTASSAPGQGDTPVFTQSQISAFYDEVRRGLWKNDPAGKARREQDIITASTTGRIMAG